MHMRYMLSTYKYSWPGIISIPHTRSDLINKRRERLCHAIVKATFPRQFNAPSFPALPKTILSKQTESVSLYHTPPHTEPVVTRFGIALLQLKLQPIPLLMHSNGLWKNIISPKLTAFHPPSTSFAKTPSSFSLPSRSQMLTLQKLNPMLLGIETFKRDNSHLRTANKKQTERVKRHIT